MTTTGEQPAAKAEKPLSENSTVRVSLVIALLGLAATAGAAHYRIGALEKQAEEAALVVRSMEKDQTALLVRVTVAESSFAEIKESLKELKAMVAELRGGARSVNWRQPREPGQ